MRERLAAVLHHPWTHAVMGVLLVASGIGEVLEPFLDGVEGNEATLGAHHGVTLFGVYTILQALTKLTDGVKDVGEGLEKLRDRGGEVEPSNGQGG
ncbi:MAG: hypothetical protein JXB05_33765 [Myxococcaceae bacterium]|nr:hypothetical protein [Myxococcaceae bacterium]